jgi:probable rRNA maturation factor
MLMALAKSAARARANPIRRSPARAAPELELTVQVATTSRAIPEKALFRKWIRAALNADARVTVRVVGLREGRALNRTYRGKDYATNVLTFVLREAPQYEGDLALCAPVVAREARAQRKPLEAHYAHLTVHGILHLQGWRHDSESRAAEMEAREARILERLGFSDPYAPSPSHG